MDLIFHLQLTDLGVSLIFCYFLMPQPFFDIIILMTVLVVYLA